MKPAYHQYRVTVEHEATGTRYVVNVGANGKAIAERRAIAQCIRVHGGRGYHPVEVLDLGVDEIRAN